MIMLGPCMIIIYGLICLFRMYGLYDHIWVVDPLFIEVFGARIVGHRRQ